MKMLLQSIDLFPYRINLNYKGRPFFHTIFGQIQSILFFVVLAFCVYKSSEDIIKSTNPKLMYKESFLKRTISDTFNLSSFVKTINYTFEIQVNTNDINEDFQAILNDHLKINLELTFYENFTSLKFFAKNFTYFEIKNITDQSEAKESNIDNNRDENKIIIVNKTSSHNNTYKYLIYIKYNVNEDTEFQLEPEKNINPRNKKALKREKIPHETFESSRFLTHNPDDHQFFFSKKYFKFSEFNLNPMMDIGIYSSLIDTNNENPLKLKNFETKIIKKKGILNYIDSLVDPENRLFFEPHYKNFEFCNEGWGFQHQVVELKDDSDLFFSTFKSSYLLQEIFFYQIPIKELGHNNKLDYLSFSLSRKMKSQTRIFKKVPNVLAELSGIFSCLIIIGNLIVGKLNKMRYEVEIINNLFYSNCPEENIEFMNKRIKSGKEICLREFNNTSNANNNKEQLARDKVSPIFKKDRKTSFDINNNFENNHINIRKDEKNYWNNLHLNNNNNNDTKFGDENSCINLKQNEKSIPIGDLNKTFQKPMGEKNFDESELNSKNILANNLKKNDNVQYDTVLKEKIKAFLKNKKCDKYKNKLIIINNSDLIKAVFCTKKYKDENIIRHEEILSYTKEKIYGYTDVIRLMRLYEKFEKLKNMVLNKNQLSAFDFISNRGLKDIYKNKEEALFDFCKYYKGKDVCTKKKEVLADENILNLINDDLKSLLE